MLGIIKDETRTVILDQTVGRAMQNQTEETGTNQRSHSLSTFPLNSKGKDFIPNVNPQRAASPKGCDPFALSPDRSGSIAHPSPQALIGVGNQVSKKHEKILLQLIVFAVNIFHGIIERSFVSHSSGDALQRKFNAL